MVLVVDKALTALVVLEWPPPLTGLLTRPSAVLFRAELSALILCCPAASSLSCSSWFSRPPGSVGTEDGGGNPIPVVYVGVNT